MYRRASIYIVIVFITFLICPLNAGQSVDSGLSQEISSMSIEELMNVKVITVSNFQETKKNAPGNIIYIERSELLQRGYNDLVEIFNDLPGIDFSQTWGDLYYKSYWRGYRQGLSSPFLLMLDGKNINHLYYHWTDILVSIPISMVDHIEIVYGPVSSVYGANALMGVFNIITKKDKEKNGTSVDAKFSYGSFVSKVSDLTVFHKINDLSFRISAFLNYGDLDKNKLEKYEYTKSKYVKDKKLWGDFVDSGFFPGEYSSFRENKGFTFSTILDNTEFGVQYYRVDNKYGVNYAYDKAPPGCNWIEDDYFLFLDSKNDINPNIVSNTYIRFRQSNLPNSSSSLEQVSDFGEQRLIKFGYWQLTNNSWSIYQDFDLNYFDDVNIKIGFNYEAQQLQKAYDMAWGETVAPDNSQNYSYPHPPDNTRKTENSMLWEYSGAYIQSKYDFSNLIKSDFNHYISAGLRYDYTTEFESYLTYRFAYILNYKNYGFKLMYGNAIQEPAPRQLYGEWAGSSVNSGLEPEESHNLESVLFYSDKIFYIMFNPYYNIVHNAINNINGIPINISKREVYGVDVHFSMQSTLSKDVKFKFWSYISLIDTKEDRFDNDANMIGEQQIGDIAPYKLYFGTNIGYKSINLNLRSRYISKKDNYQSNPVPETPPYFTMDANLILRNVFENISFGIKVNNIFDKTYYHPGIRDANAGIIPGYFDANDNWYGSSGWMNSQLPQPGRAIYLQLMINIE